MTKPLALCYYENLLLGNQLVNRLQDLGYRVQIASDGENLMARATEERPFLIVADLNGRSADMCRVIAELKQGGNTKHIPILAFAPRGNASLPAAAHAAGATLVAVENGLLQQLPELLARVLEVE